MIIVTEIENQRNSSNPNPEALIINGHIASPSFHQPTDVPAEEMIYRLAGFFSQYLRCASELLPVLSLWTLHTHCITAADATPYLNICSTEKQSGKTLCLE